MSKLFSSSCTMALGHHNIILKSQLCFLSKCNNVSLYQPNSSARSYPYDPSSPKSSGWIITVTAQGFGPSGAALNRTDGRTSEGRVEMKAPSCLIIVQLAWWQWAFPPLVSHFNLLSQLEIQAAALYHLLLEPRWQSGAHPERGEKTISKESREKQKEIAI